MKNLLIVLAVIILAGVGWYLFAGKAVHQMPMTTSVNPVQASGSQTAYVCPVSGEKTDPSKAIAKVEYKGKTYFLCCQDCVTMFNKNPEKYIKK